MEGPRGGIFTHGCKSFALDNQTGSLRFHEHADSKRAHPRRQSLGGWLPTPHLGPRPRGVQIRPAAAEAVLSLNSRMGAAHEGTQAQTGIGSSSPQHARAPPRSLPPAADLNDLYAFDPGTLTWTAPLTSGVPPTPRDGVGFASVEGNLYVFGGGYYDFVAFSGEPCGGSLANIRKVAHLKKGVRARAHPHVGNDSFRLRIRGDTPSSSSAKCAH